MRKIFLIFITFYSIHVYSQVTVGVSAVDESGSNSTINSVGFGLDKSDRTVLVDPTEIDYFDFANAPFVDVKEYGATGNGTTDDYTSINNAFEAVKTGGILFIPEGTYKMSNYVNKIFSGDVSIICSGDVKFTTSITGSGTAKYILNLRCDTIARVTDTDTLTIGDTLMVVSSHGLDTNDIIRIGTSVYYDSDTKHGELQKVKRISGDTVFFFAPIQDVYNGFYVRKINSYRLSIQGGEFIGAGTNYEAFQNIHLDGFNNIWIEGVKSNSGHYSGLMLKNIYGGTIINCEFSDAVKNGLGYGSMVDGCQNVTYYKCTAKNSAHAIAMGGEFPVRSIVVESCDIYGKTGHPYPLENHPVAFDIRMSGNRIYNGGIRIRGNNQIVEGNTIYPQAAQSGIDIQAWTEKSDYIILRDNTIIDKLKDKATIGIGLYYNTSGDTINNLIIENNLIDVKQYGFYIGRNYTTADSNYIKDLDLKNNNISTVSDAAIYVQNYNRVLNVFITGGKIRTANGYGIYIDSSDSTEVTKINAVDFITTSTHSPIYLMTKVKIGVVSNCYINGDIANTDGIRLRSRKSILKDNQIFNILNGGFIVGSECRIFWDVNNIKSVSGNVTNSATTTHTVEIQ